MWAAPCPEGALLALDWALAGRGRLSESLEALAAALLALDLRVVVKKIKNEILIYILTTISTKINHGTALAALLALDLRVMITKMKMK